ncbi:MAG: tetratricopeptide repeat protein [Granulosicoccus sp.]
MIQTLPVIALTTAALTACGGGGGSTPAQGERSGESYLYVSPSDYYFGTKDVGTTTVESVRIENRGADIYELSSVRIRGSIGNADETEYTPEEFAAAVLPVIELQPSESVSIDVSFKPITEKQKKANLVVDYTTVTTATVAANEAEQLYYTAHDQEQSGQYLTARKTYRDYIQADPATVNERRAAIKLPILDEANMYDAGNDLHLYLMAIDQRDEGRFTEALQTLQKVDEQYADSYLADDALYLSGYIKLMDMSDDASALQTMQQLQTRYPDSSYYDTALYTEALAELELGNLLLAIDLLGSLRDRHTGFIAFGLPFAKDNLVSRLWFDRATGILDDINPV